MKQREIRVHLYGPLKEAFGRSSVAVKVDARAEVRDLRRLLAARLGPAADILKKSAIADENGILDEGSKLGGSSFRILPPVAGG